MVEGYKIDFAPYLENRNSYQKSKLGFTQWTPKNPGTTHLELKQKDTQNDVHTFLSFVKNLWFD